MDWRIERYRIMARMGSARSAAEARIEREGREMAQSYWACFGAGMILLALATLLGL